MGFYSVVVFVLLGIAVLKAIHEAKEAKELAKKNKTQLQQAFDKIQYLQEQVDTLSADSFLLASEKKEKSIAQNQKKEDVVSKKVEASANDALLQSFTSKPKIPSTHDVHQKEEAQKPSIEPSLKDIKETQKEKKEVAFVQQAVLGSEKKDTVIVAKEKKSIWQYPLWKKIEKQFSENWAGILGSVILVLGISFLGVYASLKVNEFWRFLMLVATSLFMFGLFYFLQSKNKWLRLALWLRSSAAAIFLFACLASGHVSGLKWIHHSLYAMAFLALGVVVNLYLAAIGKQQVFASLHVLLSLLALAVTPQNYMTLGIAFVVSFVGVLLTYREKWQHHLLLTISLFFAYHLFWFYTTKATDVAADSFSVSLFLPLVFSSLIFLAALAVHYQKLYRNIGFDKKVFFAHSLNWFYFAVSFFYYSNKQSWQSIPLFAVAALAFVMAEHARRLKIRWLHYSDTIAAQFLMLSAILVLARWELSYPLLFSLMLLQSLSFTAIITFARSLFLFRFGVVLIQVIAIVVLYFFYLEYLRQGSLSYNTILFLCLGIILAFFLFHLFLKRKKEQVWLFYDGIFSFRLPFKQEFSLSAFFMGVFLMAIVLISYKQITFYYVAATVTLLFLFLRSRIYANGFDAGLACAFILIHVVTWYAFPLPYFSATQALSTNEILLRGFPLFVLSFFAFWWDFPFGSKKIYKAKQAAIYFFFLHFVLFTYILLKPFSLFLPAFSWLGMVLPLWELARRPHLLLKKNQGAERWLYHVSYSLIALFLLRHFLFHGQSQAILQVGSFFAVKHRVLLDIFALAIFFYGASLKSKVKQSYRSSVILRPLLVELISVFSLSSVIWEFDMYWYPLAGIMFAFIALAFAKKYLSLARLKLHALFFYFFSIGSALFLLLSFGVDTIGLKEKLIFVSTFLWQCLFLFFVFKNSFLKEIVFPFSFVPSFALKNMYILARVAMYAVFVFFALLSYMLLENISPLLPAVVWLAFTLPILEIARYADKMHPNSQPIGQPDRWLLHSAYALIAIFLMRHILVHLQSEAYLSLILAFSIKVRFAIELFALAVFFYWALSKSPSQKKYRSWTFLHPLFVELIGIFAIITISLELGKYWHPFAWLLFAFLSFGFGKQYASLSRLKFYSLFFYLLSIFQVTFLLGIYDVLASHWYQSEQAVGILSIVLQFGFLIFIHKEPLFDNLLFPPALQFLQKFPPKIKPFRYAVLAYPFFVSIALYLYWTFPASWLTLLWVLECFLIFALGVLLRQDHFRYTAMVGIAANIGRLIWVDLASSSTLVSALVFVGVGILMLGMHSIYIAFQKRVEADTNKQETAKEKRS